MSYIIQKPWGIEEIQELNERYMLKKLTMYKGCRCSLQYHNNKIETIYVLSGKLKIYSGNSIEKLNVKIYEQNEFVTIFPMKIHRMEAVSDCVYLETSTPDTEDTVRLEDDYGRN